MAKVSNPDNYGAGRHDVHRLGARRVGRDELRVPVRATIRDARGAVRVPGADVDCLPEIERRLRRRRRARKPPAMRNDSEDHTQHAGDRKLHRFARAKPCGDAAEGGRDADCEQVESTGDQFGPDQDRRCDPPDPMSAHLRCLQAWPCDDEG